jgi:phage terminase large subunit GpA-like protein
VSKALNLCLRVARRAIRPKSPLTVSEWSDANRVLSGEGSAEAGAWKTSRTPYLREIMDALSEESPVRKVVFMKSSQVGGTEAGSNWTGYIMDHAKGPFAVVMPTEKSLQDWMSQKFDPMAKDTPAVANVLASRSNRAGDNSAFRKRFVGGIFYAKTAGSTAELKSTSLRYAIADEIDEYDWSTLQGDPLGLLEVRLTTFHDRKLFVVSTPTMKDASRIEEQFELGDQRRFMVPCPHCDERQHLKWPNLRWHKDGRRCSSAWYVCEHCGSEISEHQKASMMAAGRWQSHNPEGLWRSYHINALYSPIGLGLSWAELADEWIEAQDDPSKLMRFVNTRLGETWADRSHDLKPNVLMARAEPYELRTIPVGCLVLTAGVDTQDDRLEIQIVGHGRDDKAWTIDYHVIPGNPAEQRVWDALADYLSAEFTNSFGRTLRIEATAIDTGGHHTHAVYAFVRSQRVRRVIAIKGASQPGRTILGKPSHQDVNWKGQTIKKGVALYTVGTDTAKHLIYARLNGDADKDPSERKMHFSTALEPSYFDGLVSETYNPRKNRWEIKKGKRNEPLDTRVYAIAASHHPELYLHKWRQSDWTKRAAMIEPESIPTSEAVAAPEETSAAIKVKHIIPNKRRPGGFAGNW